MQGYWVGVVGLVGILAVYQPCAASEMAGTLIRVGPESVVVRASDHTQMVFQVDKQDRLIAAPFLGKNVIIKFRLDQGQHKVFNFLPCVRTPAN